MNLMTFMAVKRTFVHNQTQRWSDAAVLWDKSEQVRPTSSSFQINMSHHTVHLLHTDGRATQRLPVFLVKQLSRRETGPSVPLILKAEGSASAWRPKQLRNHFPTTNSRFWCSTQKCDLQRQVTRSGEEMIVFSAIRNPCSVSLRHDDLS